MLSARSLSKISKSNIIFGCKRCSSSLTKREFKEVEIKVPWGHVAGKWWEPYDTRPILTLHGWQDNCESFDRLIRRLNRDVGFLSIDLPGHGYSSRIPDGMIYHFTVFLLTIKSISKTFNWPKISLMGHSFGSATSFLYTMFNPEEVDFVIFLDALKPMISKNRHTSIANNLENFFKYNGFLVQGEPPSYTIEEITNLITKPNRNSVLPEYAKYIYGRNICPSKIYPGKYYFTRDPRCKAALLHAFCQQEYVELAERFTMPLFIAKAKEASYYEPKENFYEVLNVLKNVSVDCDFNYVDGKHHAHLNNPENLSDLISNFIRRNNVEDRSVGGIKEEIIVEDINSSSLN